MSVKMVRDEKTNTFIYELDDDLKKIGQRILQEDTDENEINDLISNTNTQLNNIRKRLENTNYMDRTERAQLQNDIFDYEKNVGRLRMYGLDTKDAEFNIQRFNELAENRSLAFSRFENKDEYNDFIEQKERYESMLKFDLEKGKSDIDRLEQIQKGLKKTKDNLATLRLVDELKTYGIDDATKLDNVLKEKRLFYKEASELQNITKFQEEIKNDKDYDKYVSKGKDNGGVLYNQFVNFITSNPLEIVNKYNSFKEFLDSFKLSKEEQDNFNYFLGKYGAEKASEYFNSIRNTANVRFGNDVYEKMLKGDEGNEILFSYGSGVTGFVDNTFRNFMDEEEASRITSTDIALGKSREDIVNNGSYADQVAFDLANTMGNQTIPMLTSLATNLLVAPINPKLGSAMGKTLGSGMIGLSAAGGAYKQALQEGYSQDEARRYSAIIGTSEAGLEFLIGGITKLGGVALEPVIKSVTSSIKNAAIKAATRFGLEMFSEGVEESVQEILEPFFRNFSFDETQNTVDWGQVAYSGMLGAISAGIFNGTSNSLSLPGQIKTGNAIKDSGEIENLKKIGKTFSADSVAYKITNKLTEKSNALTIIKALKTVNANLSVQNQTDIQNSLIKKGVPKKDAKSISRFLNDALNGKKFNTSQRKVLESNEDIADAFISALKIDSDIGKRTNAVNSFNNFVETGIKSEYNLEENSEKKDSSQNDILEKLAMNIALKQQGIDYFVNNSSRAYEAISRVGNDNSINEFIERYKNGNLLNEIATARNVKNVDISPFTKSEPETHKTNNDGATTLSTTGETVQIKSIADIKNGKMTLKLDNGQLVDSKNVSYSSNDEALLYEMVADLGVSASEATQIIGGYSDIISANDYIRGIAEGYRYGYNNYDLNSVKDGFFRKLTNSQGEFAYNLGRMAAKSNANKSAQRKNNIRSGKYKNNTKLKNKDLDVLYSALARKTGLEIRKVEKIISGEFEANAQYITGIARVIISANADNEFGDTAHELGHYSAEFAKKEYQKVVESIAQWWIDKNGIESYEAEIQRIMKRESLSYPDAVEEFTNEGLAGLFSAEDGVAQFVDWLKSDSGYSTSEQTGIIKKLKELCDKIISAIKEILSGGHLSRVARATFNTELETANEIRKQFLASLDVAGKKITGVHTTKAEQGRLRTMDTPEGGIIPQEKNSVKKKKKPKYALSPNAFSKALTASEWIKYNNAMTSGFDAGLRINDHAMLVEGENSPFQYKLVIYDNSFEESPITAVYGMAEIDYTEEDVHAIAKFVVDLEDKKYDRKVRKAILRTYFENLGCILWRYSITGNSKGKYGREVQKGRRNIQSESSGGAVYRGNKKTEVKNSLKELLQYTESEFNNFGWASYYDVVTARERETLLSRYADFRHNKDKYPLTSDGEAVIHSTEIPDVIMYVKGPISNPQITKIIRINTDNEYLMYYLREEILQHEGCGCQFPYEIINDFNEKEFFDIFTPQGYGTYRAIRDYLRSEGGNSEDSLSESEGREDGRRVFRNSKTNRRRISKNSLKDEVNIYDDIYYPKNLRERSAFNRTIANKTSDMQDGEIRKLVIYTENNVYFVTAYGYMSGDVEDVLEIRGNEEKIKQRVDEFYGRNYGSAVDGIRGIKYGEGYGYWNSYGLGYEGKYAEAVPSNSGSSFVDGIGNFRRNIKDNWSQREKTQANRGNGKAKDPKLSIKDLDTVAYSDIVNLNSNRSILSHSLESTVQNDVERKYIREYKANIENLDSQEKRLKEINAEIRTISFSKGKSDKKKLAELHEEKRKTENRINIYDKKLLRLESTKPISDLLEREKKRVKKQIQAESKKRLDAYKKEYDLKVETIKQRNQENLAKSRENRKRTELRHKIISKATELNNLLLKGTKEKHVPSALRKSTADALALINMDTVNAEERLKKIQEKIDKAKTPEKALKWQETYNRVKIQGENSAVKISVLKALYDDVEASKNNEENNILYNAFNESIKEAINNLDESIGNTPLAKMTSAQLESVYEMYKAVSKAISMANKSFKESKNMTISEMGNAVIAEIEQVHKTKDKSLKITAPIKTFDMNNKKPIYAMRYIGSDTLIEAFDNVRKGEDVWAHDISDAREFFLGVARDTGYFNWTPEKKKEHKSYTFTANNGKEFSLTIGEIMSLYAYSRRGEEALNHIRIGGFVYDSAKEVKKTQSKIGFTYSVNTSDTFTLSDETLGEIISILTDEQKRFAEEMQTYLSEVMGEKGNEVSREMYDIDLFKDKNYFPLKSSKQYMFEENEVAGVAKLKNSGFTKKLTPGANNPIILSDFMDVWANHVNQMSMYHALVLPIEDFNRIYNYKVPNYSGKGQSSVKSVLRGNLGDYACNYIEELITQLNSRVRNDTSLSFAEKSFSLMKKGATFASLSVMIQQPSAIMRAMAHISPKFFVKPQSYDWKKLSKTWDECKTYAPVAIIKEMGYFDTNTGQNTVDWLTAREYDTFKSWAGGLVHNSAHRDDVLSKGASIMDEITWCYIWEAVKAETLEKTNLEKNSEEFLTRCGERFTDIITHTQVYDSVLSRSSLMRSKDLGVRMATAFMAEPTTAINMIEDAVIQAKRNGKDGKVFAGKVFGSVIASIVLNAALVSVVHASRKEAKEEENNDGKINKTWVENYIGSFTGELLDAINPLTYLPYIKDIVSLFQGYDVERTDVALFSDLANAIRGLASDDVSTLKKVIRFTGALFAFTGVPFTNMANDSFGIWHTAKNATNGVETTNQFIKESVFANLPFFKKEFSKTDSLYYAIISGDEVSIKRAEEVFEDRDAINSAIKKALREKDERIRKAAQARIDGDMTTYKSVVKEITAEGHFNQDLVVGAVNNEMDVIKKNISENTSAGNEEEPETTEISSIYKTSDVNVELEYGDYSTAQDIIQDLVNVKMENGKTEKEAKASIKTSVTSYWKKKYLSAYEENDYAEMSNIKEALEGSGLYEDVDDTLENWLN